VVRVFLDANVLFSAAYRPDAGIRRLWRIATVHLVTSDYAAEEARRNLDTAEQRADLEALLAVLEIAGSPPDRHIPSAPKLPDKDRPILIAAIEARATHLLSGDVEHFGPYFGCTVEGVLILPPADFLRLVS
jgi:predicted nucleic acid-binding protein